MEGSISSFWQGETIRLFSTKKFHDVYLRLLSNFQPSLIPPPFRPPFSHSDISQEYSLWSSLLLQNIGLTRL